MSEARRHICLGFTDERYPEGTHICYLYNDDEERRRILPLFARDALREQECFRYVADVPDRAGLAQAMEALGLASVVREAPGAIEIATASEGYFPDGRFDPDAMLARLRGAYEECIAAGQAGARFAGEMGWALRGIPGADRILECEARINDLVKEAPVTVMCQYDLRQFDGAMIFDVMAVHPVMIWAATSCAIPSTAALGPAMGIAMAAEDRQPDAAVLGRLLVIQQAIDALPDDARLAAFVRRALGGVPGIADAHVHLEGRTTPPTAAIAALLDCCKGGAGPAPGGKLERNIGQRGHCFPIRAPERHFGCLVVQVADEEALRPYRDFLANIASTISRLLSARLYQQRLVELNEELRQARDSLELRVVERTRELEYRATHDPLTGLANRPLLLDRLHTTIAHARRDGRVVVVAYLDLDSFSFMNTGLGNACGDAFLRATADRLCGVLPDCDAVARIGSDEFVILLGDLDAVERSGRWLQAMLAAVREPLRLEGKNVVVTASIGASVYPFDGDEPELLLRRANSAMHRAKQSGKDGVQFYASTRDAAVAERMEREAELRVAIPAGQLVLYYQPKLELHSGAWAGVEALVRWQHPTRGLLPPAEFIPLAEESSLIVALGEYVLLHACRQAAQWHRDGLPGKSVAVNIAACQLRDRGIVEVVDAVLRDTGLPPSCLELEITESSMMHDVDHVSSLLRELKALGVRISIDDFGTGYSSLSSLRYFRVDKLKVDRSFVQEIEADRSAAAVALAVISFARTLDMQVNAEGVETPGQAGFLQRNGCDELQGYLLSRPLPAAELEALYRKGDPPAWRSALA